MTEATNITQGTAEWHEIIERRLEHSGDLSRMRELSRLLSKSESDLTADVKAHGFGSLATLIARMVFRQSVSRTAPDTWPRNSRTPDTWPQHRRKGE